MANRARNLARKSTPAPVGVNVGYTMKDIIIATENGYKRGHEDGFGQGHDIGAETTLKTCYAAMCLALKQEFGFGAKRCLRALQRADRQMFEFLDFGEAVQQVYDDLGIVMDFKDGIERVKEAEND